MSKVPVQKGKISADRPPTMKMETYAERVSSTRAENAMKRDGQTLKLHTPKGGKK